MHPHRSDAGYAWLYVGSAHARHTRLADVRAQPAPWRDTHSIGVGRCDQYLAYRMRSGNILLLRCGRKAHLGRSVFLRYEGLDRLVNIVSGLIRS